MQDIFEELKKISAAIEAAQPGNAEELEAFRIRYLGSKNILKDLFGEIKQVPPERKKEFGQLINTVKGEAESKYNGWKELMERRVDEGKKMNDMTRPAYPLPLGSRHPVSIVRNQLISIFNRIGFTVADGPEMEDDWHNFTALNTPEHHPARDMTDTFYLQTNPDKVLRSQTSNVQVRVMESTPPPIRIIAPGRVYRNETISYKHHIIFHQIEGLYVDHQVSFADLKQTLYYFVQEFFGDDFEIRFRPSYFPFTEPSAEMDLRRKGTEKWMEILGCGLVHPQVLKNCGIGPEQFSGFAFGMGVERLAMQKYGITDIRLLFENDQRFLDQFSFAF